MTTATAPVALPRDAERVYEELRQQLAWSRGNPDWSPAVSRRSLRSLTGLSDRRIRLAVEWLRERHYLIASSTSKPGYWLTDDLDEYRECAERLRVTPKVRAAMHEAIRLEVARREGAAEQASLL